MAEAVETPGIAVFARFRLPVFTAVRFREIAPRFVAKTRAEAGCITYDLAEDVLDTGLFHVSELWSNEAALRAHFVAPHMAELNEIRQQIGISERRLQVFALAGAVAV